MGNVLSIGNMTLKRFCVINVSDWFPARLDEPTSLQYIHDVTFSRFVYDSKMKEIIIICCIKREKEKGERVLRVVNTFKN